MLSRKALAMVVAEFLGTYVLASVVLSMVGRTSLAFFPAAAAGLTLAALVLILEPASGAHLNPVVTLGLWMRRKVATSDMVVYVAIQMLAGFTAFRINEYYMNQLLPDRASQNIDGQAILAEVLGTLVFTFGVAAAVYSIQNSVQKAGVIGMSLFVGILIASLGGNGLLNPAVAIGVNSLSVSYVIGPLIGSFVGFNLYALLFAPVQAGKKTRKS
jgi:aquaporin Z